MPIKRLKEFLDSQDVKYETISHSPAYTAQQIAALAHIPGKNLAKTVIIKIAGEMAMAVLPASYQVDFDLLKKAIGAEDVELATEKEFKDIFPESDVGAMPPFGNLYGMRTLVAASLVEDRQIAFNAGSHSELIKMEYKDYERLVKPQVMRFSDL